MSLTKLRQETSSMTAFGTKNASAMRAIVEFGCRLAPGIARLIRGRRDPVCHRLPGRVPYLSGRLAAIGREASRPRESLYRHCFHPDLGPRLAFGGYARPAFGAIPPIAEMQVCWFAAICRGDNALPDPLRMRLSIFDDDMAARRQFGRDATRIGSLTDFLRILDAIVGDIGCRPEGLLPRRPSMWWKALAAPVMGAQFRLVGPGSKPELARRVLTEIAVEPEFLLRYLAMAVGGEAIGRLPGLARLRPVVPWI